MAKSGRVFLRGMTSETYGLKEFRTAQLAAPRVRDNSVVVDDAKVGHSGDSDESRTWWRVGPGDDPFLTQTLQVHFVQLPPRSSNHGHGHQNEAAFYILEGNGYEVHDGERYDWATGDLVLVHTDSVHRHFNPYDEQATALVMKAKCAWMYLGLIQQGRSGPLADADKYGERVDWSQIWTPGVEKRRKVVKQAETTWETTCWRQGPRAVVPGHDRRAHVQRRRLRAGHPGGQPLRQALAHGRRGALRPRRLGLQPALGGSRRPGRQVLRQDRQRADQARDQDRRHALRPAQNTIAQHFSADGQPLRLLSGQNRLFKQLGYNQVAYLENAPEYGAAVGA